MNDNLPQPREYDAVLGGKNSYLIYAAVLGGIEGLLMRLNNAKNREERIAFLSKINEYNAIESSENGKKILVKL